MGGRRHFSNFPRPLRDGAAFLRPGLAADFLKSESLRYPPAHLPLGQCAKPNPEPRVPNPETRPLVTPVDYKHGHPRETDDAIELWPSDRVQLAVQGLVLRENGCRCEEGIVYYAQTRQRVRVPLRQEPERAREARRRQAQPPEPLPPPRPSREPVPEPAEWTQEASPAARIPAPPPSDAHKK